MQKKCNNCGWNNPDGIQYCEKCNNRLVDVNCYSQNDPRATMADVNPRATMADVNPRATVAEFPTENAREYKLLCLDDRVGNIVVLSSTYPLTLIDGEIILLGGLRYKVL